MRRRDILKGFSFLPLFGIAATKIPVEAKAEISEDDPAFRKYRDFKYYWTGWKTFPDSARIAGQWIADKIDEDVHIHSCVPGYADQHMIGAVFCLVTRVDQKFLTIASSFEDREEEKWKAYDLLLKEIDKYYDDLSHSVKPDYKFNFSGFKE